MLEYEEVSVRDLRKKARYFARCKEIVWNCWSNEYIRSLVLRKTQKWLKKQTSNPKVGEVVLIKGVMNHNQWRIGVVERLI